MTGAAMTQNQPSWIPNMPNNPPGNADQGQTFIAIDAGTMLSQEVFGQRMEWLIDYLHDAPKAKDAERIYLPGEMEWDKREHALAHGMILPPDVVDSLNGLAQDAGIEAAPLQVVEA
jgi:ureidoglycolate dehydrogenase (NAD+)